MELFHLVFAFCALSICVVSLALSYLFAKAFESASRNTETIDFIKSQLIIGAGFIESAMIFIIVIFLMLFLKLN